MIISSKVSLQNQRMNKDFQGKCTLKDFITTQSTLQKTLEESNMTKKKINTALNAQEGINPLAEQISNEDRKESNTTMAE